MRFILALAIICPLAACQEKECDEIRMYAAIKDKAMLELVSPGSAVFPELSEINPVVTKDPDHGRCDMHVITHVDSQNSFGALLRSRIVASAKLFESGRLEVIVYVY